MQLSVLSESMHPTAQQASTVDWYYQHYQVLPGSSTTSTQYVLALFNDGNKRPMTSTVSTIQLCPAAQQDCPCTHRAEISCERSISCSKMPEQHASVKLLLPVLASTCAHHA
jgi:hypothetical protein